MNDINEIENENERIDLSIHLEKEVDHRVLTVWLDGIPSYVTDYDTSTDKLAGINNVPLIIGSEHCDV